MPVKQIQKIDVTLGTFLRFFAVAILIFLAYYLLQMIAAILFAIVIASAIEPIINWLGRRHVSRIITVILIYLFAAMVFAGLVYLVLPAVATELQNFISSYPIYQRELLSEIQAVTGIPLLSFLSDNSQSILISSPDQLTQLAQSTFQLTINVFGGLMLAIITAVISFYLATQKNGIENFLRLVTPLEYEEYAVDLWIRAQKKMGQWLRAQLILGLIVGVLVYIALTLLGIRFALIFAALTAILEIIPVIGPILAAVPAVVIAFVQSPVLGLTVIVTYFIIQQIESHLIVPTVMRRTVGLNPLVVILALLIGGKLGGVLGLLLAVPLASVVVEFLSDTDRKKRGLFQYGGGS
ncbi:MAG: AI-2E family transporter [bacterium]|nr:AI-2E family transporter [bacterium]